MTDDAPPTRTPDAMDRFAEMLRVGPCDEPSPPRVIVPATATQTMLDIVIPFPAHLAREHPDPADPWHDAMHAATLVDQVAAASLYRRLVVAALWQQGFRRGDETGRDDAREDR